MVSQLVLAPTAQASSCVSRGSRFDLAPRAAGKVRRREERKHARGGACLVVAHVEANLAPLACIGSDGLRCRRCGAHVRVGFRVDHPPPLTLEYAALSACSLYAPLGSSKRRRTPLRGTRCTRCKISRRPCKISRTAAAALSGHAAATCHILRARCRHVSHAQPLRVAYPHANVGLAGVVEISA